MSLQMIGRSILPVLGAGVLLWPAVIVHTLFAIGFALAVWKPRAVSL